jgi:hypothetical protein
VLERVGEVAYCLQLPSKVKIHDVFHVALFKRFQGKPPDEVVSLPYIQQGSVIPVPQKVIRARLNRGKWKVLVSWQSQSATDVTWEPVEDFKEATLMFNSRTTCFLAGRKCCRLILWGSLPKKASNEGVNNIVR